MTPARGGGWDTGKVPLEICPDPSAHNSTHNRATPQPEAGLDAAWAEAEAALPEGWVVGQLERTFATSRAKWWATAYRDNGPNSNYSTKAGDGADTPAAALLALAAALREPKP